MILQPDKHPVMMKFMCPLFSPKRDIKQHFFMSIFTVNNKNKCDALIFLVIKMNQKKATR